LRIYQPADFNPELVDSSITHVKNTIPLPIFSNQQNGNVGLLRRLPRQDLLLLTSFSPLAYYHLPINEEILAVITKRNFK